MDQYLKDVEYFVKAYAAKSGFSDVIGNKGIKNGSQHQVEATAFILRVLAQNPGLVGQVTGFEEKIETINDEGEVNTSFADIYQVGPTIVECKSWQSGGPSFQRFVTGQSGSYSQFLNYLRASTSLANLEYWFDSGKASEAQIKQQFQQLFQNKAQEVFDTLFNNPGMRQELFGARIEQVAFNYFSNTLISDTNSILYQFINAK